MGKELGVTIYVLSDIHGNLKNFESIMEQIHLQPEDTLYVLGDVIDRYPYGIEILQRIMALPNAKMLLGNHEYMMLRALRDPYDGPEDIIGENYDELAELWLFINGGQPTFQALASLSESRQAEIIEYLKALPLNIDLELGGKKFKLVHAAPVELYEEYATRDETTVTSFAVWNRTLRTKMPKTEYTLVFGHTPTLLFQNERPARIWHCDNMIGIDCGSHIAAAGRLACIRLDDMKEFYSA